MYEEVFFSSGATTCPQASQWLSPMRAKPRLARHNFGDPIKPYPNQHEQKFAELARSLGWKVTKKGWPDFFCFDPDSEEAIFVEVKPPGQKLRGQQWLVMRQLSRMGAKCFLSDGITLSPLDMEADIHQLIQPSEYFVRSSDWLF